MRCARTQPVVAVFLASALLLVEAQRMRGSFGDPQDTRGDYGVAEEPTEEIKEFQDQAAQTVEEATYASKEKLGEVATVIGQQMKDKLSSKKNGESVAMGCTAVLKAQNDGKMEWFESQPWYKKALEMCMSLLPHDEALGMLIPEKAHASHPFRSVKGPIGLLKTSCQKLSEIPAENQVRQKKWFPHAQSLCSTVQSSTPDELKALLHRQARQAETASGQLLKKTCQEVGASATNLPDDTPVRKWYHFMTAVCSKLGTRKVKFGSFQKRCKWLQQVKATGKAELYKAAPWYSHLDKACSWLTGRGRGHGGSLKDSVRRDAVSGAVVTV